MHTVLFVFLDGVGLGPDSNDNPFASAPTPNLRALIGHSFVNDAEIGRDGLLFRGIDATLGVDGLPQSATGQTALFTGVNAAQAVGMHVATYPTKPLRDLLARQSIFKRAAEAGKRVTFANPFHAIYWQAVEAGQVRLSATTLAMQASGARFRDFTDLERGEAVFWDITHEIAPFGRRPRLRRKRSDGDAPLPDFRFPVPPITPEEAGRRLAVLAASHDLTLYESFLTDLAGHRRLPITPEQAIATVDAFLGAVLKHRSADNTLVLTSDHGNLETRSFKGHTINPVPLIIVGPAVKHFRHVREITQVGPAILAALGA